MEGGQLLKSAIEPPDQTLRRTGSLEKNQICGHATVRRQPQMGTNPREADFTQLLLKAPEGRSYCVRLWRGSSILEPWNRIQILLNIPKQGQNLIYQGRSLQDHYTLQECNITTDSTIIINLRLRGGCSGSSSKNTSFRNTGSFKDAVKGKGKNIQPKPALAPELPGPYIVEQKLESEVTNLHTDIATHVVICIFNGFWPKSNALHHWILSTWSPDCEIHLCSKGFFIVSFNIEQ